MLNKLGLPLLSVKYAIVVVALLWGPGAHADIWLSGDDPVVQLQKHKETPHDFMDLFKPALDSEWANAVQGVKVFKISTQFALRATDDQLTALITDLQRRHIALGIELGTLVGSERCGKGVEGYGAPMAVETLAKRIKSHGGQLDFIGFDEPVWHGHTAKGKAPSGSPFCSDSIPYLVDQIAPKLALLQQYFPNAQFGDIAPISGRNPELLADVVEFYDQMRQRGHIKLTFFHADISWHTKNWLPILQELSGRLHMRGVRVGVICNGGGSEVKGQEAKSNDAWINTAIESCRAVANDPRIKPDDFIVQSWEPLPTKMLPETDTGSMTYEVKAIMGFAHK